MVYLEVHSEYSLLEGTAPVASVVGRAVEAGVSSLALTDTGGLYGAIPFYRAAKQAGLRPIIGTRIKDVVLLARDREGYAHLCQAVTEYHLEGRENHERWAQSPHLFTLTSDANCLRALHAAGCQPIAALAHWGTPRSRNAAQRLYDLAQSLGLRAAAANPVYYLDPPDVHLHRVLSAIRLNGSAGNLRPDQLAPPEAWFRSPKELRQLYEDWPEALFNAEWIAEHCNVELSFGTPLFPGCSIPAGETPYSHLWQLAVDGLRERYPNVTPQHTARLQYELEVINDLGFVPYFLIVWDIVRHARAQDIPIMGRGSAANSLVAYALRITRADPFKYDLYFERFLNRARTDCPDIDLDICWRRRDDVIDYVYEKYGAERVAMIATFNTFKARAAVREIARAYGLTPREVARVSRLLPHYRAGDIRAAAQHLPECRGLNLNEEPFTSIIEMAERIDGFPRHLSIHAGGVVIAPEPLTRFVPLQRSAKGIVITQYDMHPIEDLGLIKMDLLGHRSLTVIDECAELVSRNRGIAVDVEALPEPDPLTAKLIREGRTIGCFQIESPAMRALLRHTFSENTDMLIKTLSLVRPGPSGSGMKERFIARRHGREAVEFMHPKLKEVLGDTYGVMLYQEDILKVAHVIANMTLAEADALRRAMTKKRSPMEMARHMKTFIDKAVANGVDREAAEQIWERIAHFASYSYCKAHAAGYGEISYQATYLKAHFPAEFLACVLTNRGGYYHTGVYKEEARRMGAGVLPPDVNKSGYTYGVEGEAIRVGLMEIRQLTRKAAEAILETRRERPFANLTDLVRRTGIGPADSETLIRAGACDSFGKARPLLNWELSLLTQKPDYKPSQQDAGLVPYEGVGESGALPPLPDVPRRERSDLEWQQLGLLCSTHPLEYFQPALLERTLVLAEDLEAYAGRTVTLFGWAVAERRVGLNDRGAMKFVTFEDPTATFEGVFFPEAYQHCGHLLTSHGPFFVTGKVQYEDHYCAIIADTAELAPGRGAFDGGEAA